MEDFQISTNKQLLDRELIHNFLTNHSYWAQGRSFETVNTSIENSLCFGLYDSQGRQAGFARVLTDYAIFGYVMDVFILPEYRGKGLGKLLIDRIKKHPDLQNLKKMMLATQDAQTLYAQFGFEVVKKPETLMELLF